MNLKEALLTQAPSLALQRAAADEIARLTRKIEDLEKELEESESEAFLSRQYFQDSSDEHRATNGAPKRKLK